MPDRQERRGRRVERVEARGLQIPEAALLGLLQSVFGPQPPQVQGPPSAEGFTGIDPSLFPATPPPGAYGTPGAGTGGGGGGAGGLAPFEQYLGQEGAGLDPALLDAVQPPPFPQAQQTGGPAPIIEDPFAMQPQGPASAAAPPPAAAVGAAESPFDPMEELFRSAFDPEAIAQNQAARRRDALSAGLVGAGSALLGNIGNPAAGFGAAGPAFLDPVQAAREATRQEPRQIAAEYVRAQGQLADAEYRKALTERAQKPTIRVTDEASLKAAIDAGEVDPAEVPEWQVAFAADDQRRLDFLNKQMEFRSIARAEEARLAAERTAAQAELQSSLIEERQKRAEERGAPAVIAKAREDRIKAAKARDEDYGQLPDLSYRNIDRLERAAAQFPDYADRIQQVIELIRTGEAGSRPQEFQDLMDELEAVFNALSGG